MKNLIFLKEKKRENIDELIKKKRRNQCARYKRESKKGVGI